jgi:hypothetical protein
MPIHIGSANQCRAKKRLLLRESGMKKPRTKVNFFIACPRKLKTYGVRQR